MRCINYIMSNFWIVTFTILWLLGLSNNINCKHLMIIHHSDMIMWYITKLMWSKLLVTSQSTMWKMNDPNLSSSVLSSIGCTLPRKLYQWHLDLPCWQQRGCWTSGSHIDGAGSWGRLCSTWLVLWSCVCQFSQLVLEVNQWLILFIILSSIITIIY